jgi:hypothetical protein
MACSKKSAFLKSRGFLSSAWNAKKATWPAIDCELHVISCRSVVIRTIRQYDVQHRTQPFNERYVRTHGEDIACVRFLDANRDHRHCHSHNDRDAGWLS